MVLGKNGCTRTLHIITMWKAIEERARNGAGGKDPDSRKRLIEGAEMGELLKQTPRWSARQQDPVEIFPAVGVLFSTCALFAPALICMHHCSKGMCEDFLSTFIFLILLGALTVTKKCCKLICLCQFEDSIQNGKLNSAS